VNITNTSRWYQSLEQDEKWANYWGMKGRYFMPHKYCLGFYFWWRPRNEKPLLSNSMRKTKPERLRLENLLSQVRHAWLVYAWIEAGLTDQPLWIKAVLTEQPRKGTDYYLVDPTVFQFTIKYHKTNKDSYQQTFMLSPPIPQTGPRTRLWKFWPDGLSDWRFKKLKIEP
jgi:hypothetical protein